MKSADQSDESLIRITLYDDRDNFAEERVLTADEASRFAGMFIVSQATDRERPAAGSVYFEPASEGVGELARSKAARTPVGHVNRNSGGDPVAATDPVVR